MPTDPQCTPQAAPQKPQTLTKALLTRVGDGWIVDATIIADIGDGTPWPYVQKFIYATSEEMLAALTKTVMRSVEVPQ